MALRRAVSAPLPALEGLWCALRVPLWLGGRRLRDLVEAPVSGRAPGRGFELARAAASVALRHLARLPGGVWRDTCLYRSVACCLLRRRRGLPGRLTLGARPADAPDSPVAAHAWVTVHGPEGASDEDAAETAPASDLRPLRPAATDRHARETGP